MLLSEILFFIQPLGNPTMFEAKTAELSKIMDLAKQGFRKYGWIILEKLSELSVKPPTLLSDHIMWKVKLPVGTLLFLTSKVLGSLPYGAILRELFQCRTGKS
jgi:hypothetical protein